MSITQGRLLRELRERRGLTQLALALEAGASQGHISDVESEKCGLGLDVAEKVAPVLHVDWAVFFGDNVRRNDSKSAETET